MLFVVGFVGRRSGSFVESLGSFVDLPGSIVDSVGSFVMECRGRRDNPGKMLRYTRHPGRGMSRYTRQPEESVAIYATTRALLARQMQQTGAIDGKC